MENKVQSTFGVRKTRTTKGQTNQTNSNKYADI